MPRPRTLSSNALRLTAVLGLAVGALLAVGASAGAEPGFGSNQAMPSPVGAKKPPEAPYGAVSCPTTTSCTAVGPFGEIGTEGKPSVVTESSGSWGAVTAIPLPAGGTTGGSRPAQLNGVSCVDATDCTAVGDYPFSTKSLGPLVVTESSSVWGQSATITLPANHFVSAELGSLSSVWCASAGNCVAVGYYAGSDNTYHSMAVQEVSGVWQAATELPDPAGLTPATSGGVLESEGLSCSDVQDCTYVGVVVTKLFDFKSFAQTETTGTWGTPTIITAPGASATLLTSVACPTTATCTAVGLSAHSLFSGTSSPIIASMTAPNVWSTPVAVASPNLSPATSGGEFTSISCSGTTLCEAVGELQGARGAVPFSDSFVNGTWDSPGLIPNVPAGSGHGDDSAYTSVSCPSTSACTAIGGAGVTPYRTPNEPVYPFSSVITPTEAVGTPGMPGGVAAVPSPGSALVTWQAPASDGGAPVTKYTVTASPGGRTCTTTGSRQCRISGLANNQTFRFRVTDTTTFGPSASSAPSGPVVVGAVPSIPRGVKATAGHLFVDVSWQASRSATGERILSYVVTVSGVHVPTRTCGTRTLACRIGGLVANHVYDVVITARDASGTSAPSARTAFRSR